MEAEKMDHRPLYAIRLHHILLAYRSSIRQLESTKHTCGTHTFYCYPITGYDSPIIIITAFERYALYYVNKIVAKHSGNVAHTLDLLVFVPK